MKDIIKSVLTSENIDTFSFLDVSDCEIINFRLMPDGINTAVLWLIPYYTGSHPNRNISLYSISQDYHLFSRGLAEKMKSALLDVYPNEKFCFFCDSSPINEVKAALSSGLGILGKNRLLINEKYGSYVFIGSMLTSVKLSDISAKPIRFCLGCGSCEKACGFLSGKTDICASELNQRKSVTAEELELIKSKKIRWGCDICQEVCPMNKNVPLTDIRFFYDSILEIITPEIIEAMPKEEFQKRAFAWRGKKTVLRNITVNI